MADASKLKNRSRPRNSLGSPLGPDEIATSLNSPEIAPAVTITEAVPTLPVKPAETLVNNALQIQQCSPQTGDRALPANRRGSAIALKWVGACTHRYYVESRFLELSPELLF